MNADIQFPHLAIGVNEERFVLRLWQSMQASGHLMTLAQVRACLAIVDASFAPPPPQPQNP